MYSYDDRWILSHPLTLVEFTEERVSVFDCNVVNAEFYNDRLRTLVVSNIGPLTESTYKPVSESFIAQHGAPMPNTHYLGVSKQMCRMERFFRIISVKASFPFVLSPIASYQLAGLPGEGQGTLDDLISDIDYE